MEDSPTVGYDRERCGCWVKAWVVWLSGVRDDRVTKDTIAVEANRSVAEVRANCSTLLTLIRFNNLLRLAYIITPIEYGRG